MKRKRKYPFRVPRGLLFLMVIIPWVLMAAAWTTWDDWAVIGVGIGQVVALLALLGSDDYKHVKYMKNR